MGSTLRTIRRAASSRLGRLMVLSSMLAMSLWSASVFLPLARSQTPAAHAANGDFVHETDFSAACSSGIGVGIGFDGTHLWYSCYASNPDLYEADTLTGNVIASYNIAGGLGALAWDGVHKKLWAGWGGGAGSAGDVRLIDTTNGSSTVMFNATSSAFIDLDDGLAYDAQDNSLLISPDTSTTIYHYSTSGALLDSFPWGGSGCYNSGLAIGGSLLFEGSDGCNHVWVVNRSDHSAAFDFPTGAGGVRDEDLECDNVTFRPKTVMWSVEAYEPRRAVAFEIPQGSCATGGGLDSDGDGLLDDWELHGITIDPDGPGPLPPQFIDLPAMGADPNKPDIFLQIDWMQNATHNQKLSQAAIQIVVNAFANSPYVSPTGSVGINLHVDEGPSSILNFATGATWGSLSRAHAIPYVSNLGTGTPSNYDWSAFQAIKDANFTPTGRTPIFHYVVAAHNYDSTTSSGISRGIPSSDLIVSLGSFTGGTGSVYEQAGTLMHELGHNLGLQHGGGDGINFKPNYLSIMNYAFQLQGVIQGGVAGYFDYSRSALPTLDESNLNEPAGLGAGATGYGTRHFCGGTITPVPNASAPIDWNCNGRTTDVGISYDINGDGNSNETLTGFNDWAHLNLKGGDIGQAGAPAPLPMQTETDLLTVDLAKQITPVPIGVAVDIEPATCPNPLNANSTDTLTVAVLGTSTFDVTTINPSSIRLAGVEPKSWRLQDVATPFVPFTGKTQPTDCTAAGPDGFTDLVLVFDRQTLLKALGSVTNGQVLVVRLTGKLLQDGPAIAGEDVVVIQGTPPAQP